jgi:osmotically inducible protein OsmC
MATIHRTAKAAWQGTGKEGTGQLTTQSGVLKDSRYGFQARFADGPGTNPEELIAAAHAGCFTMALAFQLSGAGHTPERLQTEARVSMEQEGAGWTIKTVALSLQAKMPGCGPEEFQKLAEAAKANCPVSRVLKTEITLDARLD